MADAARVKVGISVDAMPRECTKAYRIFRSDCTKLHRISYGEQDFTRTRSSRIWENRCTKLHRNKLKIIDKDICLTELPAKAEAGGKAVKTGGKSKTEYGGCPPVKGLGETRGKRLPELLWDMVFLSLQSG